MDDFRDGHLRLYVFEAPNDKRRFTGRNEGPFEIWIPPIHPELGNAHLYSTEQFIEFYNRKMRLMHSHPDKFPPKPIKAEPKEKSVGPKGFSPQQ
jgi:hypothetical protein